MTVLTDTIHVCVKHKIDDPDDPGQHFRLSYSGAGGLEVHRDANGDAKADAWAGEPDREPVYVMTPDGKGDRTMEVERWVEHMLVSDIPLFTSMRIWAASMVVLQILVLVLLTFEPPEPVTETNNATSIGLVDSHDVIRFISDNIDKHRGYGCAMLLAFGGSFLLLACVLAKTWQVAAIVALVAAAALGGMGVVIFHGAQSTEHLSCAAVFIGAGLLAHIVVAATGPANRHTWRDILIFLLTAACGGLFLGFHLYARAKSGGRHDPDYRLHWWVAGVCEYLLYINMSVLNLLLGERVLEHLAYTVTRAIPAIIEAHLSVLGNDNHLMAGRWHKSWPKVQ